MVLDIDSYTLFAIIIGVPTLITVPITIFLMKLKSRLDSHDKCLERLEQSIESFRNENKSDRQDVKIATKEDKVDLKLELGAIKENIKNVESFLRENIPPLKRRGKSNI